MLAQGRGGQSPVVVLRGQAGIGKTALLRYAARQAAGFRIVEVVGVQAEMELAFAGVHQLCAPMLAHLGALPEPQRDALRVALGVSAGDRPDRFLVALAVLSLLSEVAAERPLLCVLDDAQWLDAASGQVLGCVARRLLAESVVMVFGVREPIAGHALDGLPESSLGGLHEADARALLGRALRGRLDDRVRDRIIAETGGNPLALLELARSMSAPERAGGFVVPAAGDLPGQVEEQYVQRLGELPEATQRLLLLAAADPLGDATLLWRAAARLSIDATALSPATDVGLLQIDDRVRFRHPLVRSAVYRAASVDELRRVHEALAEVCDPESDPDRRAWHRSLAVSGPDEEVAAELERSAGRAQARGGVAAAGAFLQSAAALSQDPGRAAERALAAAHTTFQTGAFEAALGLVATAEAYPLDGFQSARADLLRAHVAFASGYGNDAGPLLLQAARRLAPFDLGLARKTYLRAWGAATAAGPFGGGGRVLSEICHATRALPLPTDAMDPLDLLLDGLALMTTDGRSAATPILQHAAKAIAEMSVESVLRWGALAVTAATAVWDSELFSAIAERQVQIVRDAGALAELPIHLSTLVVEKAWAGDFASAELLVAESDSVAGATGSQVLTHAALRLRALQGKEAEASTLIETTIKQAKARGQEDGEAARMAYWAAAVLYNGLARYDEAASAARQVVANAIGPWTSVWVLPELVEAAARLEDTATARDALERLAETTQPSGTDFALGIEARCRALLSDGGAADELHREAIERLGRTRLRPERARAHLLYGEWLHREGRRVEASGQLHMAHDMLAAIGMEAFAERARRELIKSGEKVRKSASAVRDELSPQEAQIALLARDGLTNAEIGARLFLSPRTVEWHLHSIFAKLGIDSRKALSGALPKPET
jgi:DNA-binding CsgD family transcriptional regulator